MSGTSLPTMSHRRSRLARGIVIAFAAAALGATTRLVLAADDDRAAADGALREVDAAPPEKRAVSSEMVGRSRAATERAAKLRASGDEVRARIADGAARTWAEAARDTLRAAELEDRANVARRLANDAGTMAERERALLEEGVAQTGRLRAQLEAVAREGKEAPTRTNARSASTPAPTTARLDGGAR